MAEDKQALTDSLKEKIDKLKKEADSNRNSISYRNQHISENLQGLNIGDYYCQYSCSYTKDSCQIRIISREHYEANIHKGLNELLHLVIKYAHIPNLFVQSLNSLTPDIQDKVIKLISPHDNFNIFNIRYSCEQIQDKITHEFIKVFNHDLNLSQSLGNIPSMNSYDNHYQDPFNYNYDKMKTIDLDKFKQFIKFEIKKLKQIDFFNDKETNLQSLLDDIKYLETLFDKNNKLSEEIQILRKIFDVK